MNIPITRFKSTGTSSVLRPIVICLVGIALGVGLFAAMSGDIPQFFIGIYFVIVSMPIILSWHEFFEKCLLAILLLTMAIIIDKTIGLREHRGGAQGFIISLHDIALVVLWIIWFYRKRLRNDRKLHFFSAYSLPIIGILMMSLLSLYKAVDPMFSLYELIEIFKMFLVFIYVANYVAETQNLKFILFFLLLGLCIENVIVLLESTMGNSLNLPFLGTRATNDLDIQRIHSTYRVGGTLGSSNGLAWYLTSLLPILLALFFSKTKKSLKSLIIVMLSFGLFSLFLTYSRGGWIGFVLGSFFVLYFSLRKMETLKKVYLIVVNFILIGTATILILATSNPIKDRLLEDDRGSAYSRIPLMEVAVDMIKANPVIGVGLNNYTEVHHEYDYGIDKITQYYPVPVHNLFLQIAAEIGIPGLIFFLWFIATIFYQGIKHVWKEEGLSSIVLIGIIGGMIGFLVDGLVENTSLGSFNMFSLWVLSGIAVGLIKHKEKNIMILSG